MKTEDVTPLNRVGNKLLEANIFAIMEREMNKMFQNFSRILFEVEPFQAEMIAWIGPMPDVDISETDNEIQVIVDLPGIEEKDIEISFSENNLTLKGEKKQEKESEGKNYYRMERSFGQFKRIIPIPVGIQPEKVTTLFKKGVLTIRLPKTESPKEKVKEKEK